jgi:hypothetical protein
MCKDESLKKESVFIRVVGYKEGSAIKSFEPDRASPILLLGDSHVRFLSIGGEMQAKGAGLPDQLAGRLGMAVDVISVSGSGATPVREDLRAAAQKPGYLPGKKLIIWCFGAREFTESEGWDKVQVVGDPK